MAIQFNLKTQKVFLGDKEIIKVYKGNKKVYEITGRIPGYYVQVSSSDFNSSGDYTGTEEYIILPADKPSGYDIANPAVKGVATKGGYLTDASYMFRKNNSLYLELNYLDTSNVTDMGYMFYGSQATTIDVSSFDTSSVTNMQNMFFNTLPTILDLSSFDTSSVTNMNRMFTNSQATTGYARTQTDTNRFNSSSDKPSTLTFVVHPILKYVQTTTSDFNASGDYTGTAEYIILPEEKTSGYRIQNLNVKGVATNGDYLTNAANMFHGNPSLYLELDYLDTSQVIYLPQMFRGSQATSLDLSNFNTSNVIDMRLMFHSAQATTLDLSGFDTKNVTDMAYMFVRSQASTLDLSSFDISNVTSMDTMFLGAQTTTGYARTQADADKLNSSSNKPSTLTFVVKGKLVPDEFVLKQDYSVQDFQQLISYFEIDPNLSFPGTNITNVLEVSVSGYVWSMKDLYDLSYFNGVLRIYDNNYDYTLELTEDTNNGLYSDITFVFNNGA